MKKEIPWPKTEQELHDYISNLTKCDVDYNTAPELMAYAALAAFNYMSSVLGVTGFQASCADLMFFGLSRGIEGPFMVLKADAALYPQYDIGELVVNFYSDEGTKKWLKEKATELLKDKEGAHPDVVARWEQLAH